MNDLNPDKSLKFKSDRGFVDEYSQQHAKNSLRSTSYKSQEKLYGLKVKILDNGKTSFKNVLREIQVENENASVSNLDDNIITHRNSQKNQVLVYSSEKILGNKQIHKDLDNSFEAHFPHELHEHLEGKHFQGDSD